MAVKDDVALLKRIPLFSKVDESQLNVLAFSTERVNVRKDEVLYKDGQPGSAAFVVVDGEIGIRRGAATEQDPDIVAGPGSLIGEQSMFASVPYRGTATAMSPVVALKISKDLFYRVAEEFPDLAVEAMRTVNDKLDATLADLRLVQRDL
jgi:CRP-like cAMP-binding protein